MSTTRPSGNGVPVSTFVFIWNPTNASYPPDDYAADVATTTDTATGGEDVAAQMDAQSIDTGAPDAVTGTDVAMKSADIILVRKNLEVIPDAIALSRRTLRTIRGNLGWAFAYNVAAIPLAAAGLLNPLIAGLAMSLSSVFVVTNSMRLRKFRSGQTR